MIDWRDRTVQVELTTFILSCLGNVFTFIGVLTPSWQVAEDTDTQRTTDSGLWIYCPGAQACWYIFSDNLINYYEKVDVCRFLLVGDCRKKLLRTPYFFGWHYAVLIMELIAMCFGAAAIGAVIYLHFRRQFHRVGSVVLDVLLFLAFLVSSVALSVFVINGEMLESRYLIGVKNIFPKSYGYSFYLGCLGMAFWLFALFAAILMTTLNFFGRGSPDHSQLPGLDPDLYAMQKMQYHSQTSPLRPYLPSSLMDQGTPFRAGTIDSRHSTGSPLPPPEYVPTTRTFLSY